MQPTLKTSVSQVSSNQGVTLDAGNDYQILRFKGSGTTVNVTGLIFYRGYCDSSKGGGGAIANMEDSTANISISTFTKNYAKRGGGIYNDTSTMRVTTATLAKKKRPGRRRRYL